MRDYNRKYYTDHKPTELARSAAWKTLNAAAHAEHATKFYSSQGALNSHKPESRRHAA